MPEDIKKSLREKILEKSPDLTMQINATEQQMADFRIEIQGSKIIRKGKFGKVEDDTETFAISDIVFDFSRKTEDVEKSVEYSPREINLGNTKITFAVSDVEPRNSYDFPDASFVSLKYFTPQTKPRTDVPGEYRAGDYFELKVVNKDGSGRTFYLEQNLEIFDR